MKKYSIMLLVPLIALLLSSCSMHLGLGKIFKSGSSQPVKTKHIKATHTPPSPPTPTPAGTGALIPTPSSVGNAMAIPGVDAHAQPGTLPLKVGSAAAWTNTDTAMHSAPLS